MHENTFISLSFTHLPSPNMTSSLFFPLLGGSMNEVVSVHMSFPCALATAPCPGCKCFATVSLACNFRGGLPPPPFAFWAGGFGGMAQ